MEQKKISLRFLKLKYLTLIGVVIAGMVIRFWNLDTKPLWLDEIPTALFSLGHTYSITEKQPLLNISTLDQMFEYQPVTFNQINQGSSGFEG